MLNSENKSLLSSYTASALRFVGNQSVDAYRLAGTLSINFVPSVPGFAAGYLPEAIQPIATFGASINTYLGVAPFNAAVFSLQLAFAGTAVASHTLATYLEDSENFSDNLYKQAQVVAGPYIEKVAPYIPKFDPSTAVHDYEYESTVYYEENDDEEYLSFDDEFFDLDGVEEQDQTDRAINISNEVEQVIQDIENIEDTHEQVSTNPADVIVDFGNNTPAKQAEQSPEQTNNGGNTSVADPKTTVTPENNTDAGRLSRFLSHAQNIQHSAFEKMSSTAHKVKSVMENPLQAIIRTPALIASKIEQFIKSFSSRSNPIDLTIV